MSGNPALGDHRPVLRPPGLFDLDLVVSPDGGLASRDRIQTPLSAADLVELVRRAGATDSDLRLLAVPGEQNLPLLRAVARQLGRDILVPPIGSDLIRVPATPAEPYGPLRRDAADEPEADEVVPVDSETGYPVEWLTIRPDGRVGAAFGWYELVGGLIVPRHGLVTVPLPDGGRILATRRSFVADRAAAATLRTGHPALITVRVGVRGGDFVLGFYDRRTEVVDGAELAAALATVPLYQANLRMWLSWPEPEAERRRMRANLALLADVTGATVWAPAEPGATAMLDGCLDLAVVDPDGRPAWWQSYGQPGQFESDVDGRLVPIGGVDVSSTPGIPLVSGHRGQPRLEPTAWPGFACHLPILPGGRIGMRYADGTLLAIGPRQFAQSLRDHGWSGEDVVVVSPVTPEQVAGTRRHLAVLTAQLGATITIAADATSGPPPSPARRLTPPSPPRSAVPAPAPAPAPSTPASADAPPPPIRPADDRRPPRIPDYSRSAVNDTLARLDPSDRAQADRLVRLAWAVAEHLVGQRHIAAVPPGERTEHLARLGALTELIDQLVGPLDPAPDPARPPAKTANDAPEPDPAPPPASTATDTPEPDPTPDPAPPPAKTTTDAPEPATAVALADGFLPDPFAPSTRIWRFIDGPRITLAPPTPRHGLAWLPPQPQTNAEAFDAFIACGADPEAALTEGVPAPALFLAGYLDLERLAARTAPGHVLRIRVETGGAVDLVASEATPPREYAAALELDDVFLLPVGWLSRCRVTATYEVGRSGDPVLTHEVDGAPLRLAPAGASHGVDGLPEEAQRWPHGRLRSTATRYVLVPEAGGLGPWQRLHAHRPTPRPGPGILAVRVGRGQAIDITATASAVAGLTAVRSTASTLAAEGVDLLLPASSYGAVTVVGAWRWRRDTWRSVDPPARRLSAWTDGWPDASPRSR